MVRADEAALLFFDVDGTLLWVNEQDLGEERSFTDFGPNESVRSAFAQLHEQGHRTFLCTGRPLSFVPESVLSLGFDGCITGAGACVMMGDEIVYETVIPRDLLIETAERMLDLGAVALLESREQTVGLSRYERELPGFADLPLVTSIADLERVAPDMRFCKISAMAEDAAWLEGFRPFAREHYEENDMGLAREFSLVGVDKGTGVERILRLLGRDVRGTFAFGDSENDLPLFRVAETCVAMGNAMDVLKEQADYVTGHAAEDGIEQALRHFGLI